MVLFIALTGETWSIPNTFSVDSPGMSLAVCSWINVISTLYQRLFNTSTFSCCTLAGVLTLGKIIHIE